MRDVEVITDGLVIAHLDDEWDLPCESIGHAQRGSGPAKWVMWFACCPRDNGSPYLLACDACKDFKLSYPALVCKTDEGGCGQVFTPGSLAYRLIEPLNKS